MEDEFPYCLPDEIQQQLNSFSSEFVEPLCLSPPNVHHHNPSSPLLPLTDALLLQTENKHELSSNNDLLLYDEISNDVPGSSASIDDSVLPSWCLISQVDYNCNGCNQLREVIHSNEFGRMKLMIHGAAGLFYHAMLDVAHSKTGFMQQYFSDLRGYSSGAVKQFLVEYGLSRQQEGQILISDSINEFYDTLCVGMNAEQVQSITTADHFRSQTVQAASVIATTDVDNNTGKGLNFSAPLPDPENQGIVLQKTGIAAQRERAESLTLEEISTLFHLPIAQASIHLHLCTTALKKACRRHGVKRWPFRKVKSADKKIAQLHKVLGTQTGADATMTEVELAQIKEARNIACEGYIGKIKRIQGWISEKMDNLRCQSGIQAEKNLIEISKLKEKIKRAMIKMSKKGKTSKSNA